MKIFGKALKKDKGFTLIELLVVVAIIGILAAVVISSLNSARKRGRDAQRVREIQEIHNAIELYIAQNGAAPDFGRPDCLNPEGYDNSCFASETNPSNWDALEAQLAPYISRLAKDPCGVNCFDYYGPNLKYRGFFAYAYLAPSTLAYLNDSIGPGTTTSSSYKIYAQNLESKNLTSFGFGVGSF
jgi:prepilin-type N-terminal cleavage/methylation domain-containing protein